MTKDRLTKVRALKPRMIESIVRRIEQCRPTSNPCGVTDADAALAACLEAHTENAERREVLPAPAEVMFAEARDQVEAEAGAEKESSRRCMHSDHQEQVRSSLAIGLLVLLAVVVIAMIAGIAPATEVVPVLGALIPLVSTAVGFYLGGRSRRPDREGQRRATQRRRRFH